MGLNFTVGKKELLRELKLAAAVADRGASIPVLANVLFAADSGDRVTLAATGLDCGLRCGCSADVRSPGRGTVPARKLLDWVKLLPDAAVEFAFGADDRVAVTCGRSRSRIVGMSAETFPELPAMPEASGALPIGTVAAMVARTGFAISHEETRFSLQGALLEIVGGVARMVATDGHRLAMVEADAAPGAGAYRAVVPKKALAELVRLGEAGEGGGTVELAKDENYLFFRVGHRVVMQRGIAGTFPDYARVLPSQDGAVMVLGRAELEQALRRVVQFSDDVSKAVRVRTVSGELTVSAASVDLGESEESVPGSGGADVEIGFNGAYLLDFLAATPEEQVALHLGEAKAAGELRPKADGGGLRYRYVVMPMRV